MALRRIFSARLKQKPVSGQVVFYLQCLMAFNAVVRGADYVTGSSSRVADIITVGTVINQIVNLEFWGWIFLVFGIELGLALFFKRHFFVFLGHGVLLAGYAMLMVSACQAVWQLHDDFRALIPPLGALLVHGYFAVKLKPWPREVIAPTAASRSRESREPEDREEYL